MTEQLVIDDARLIDDALSGRVEAFGELVTRHQDRLLTAVAPVLGCPDEALDVVQDAFVQAHAKLHTFQRSSAFYTWLYRIAFNLAISRRRRRRPHVSVEDHRQSAGVEPVSRGPAPEERLDQEERAAQVRAALGRVAEEHRAVLVLREIEELSYEEIAEILAVPVGTVRSRLHRARLEIREQLKDLWAAEPRL